MDAKHTPTPWEISRSKYKGQEHLGLRNVDSLTEAVWRVDSGAGLNPARDEANAAFIVRAVNAHDELVEALSDIVHSVGGDTGFARQQRMKKARAAIAKAEGK